MVAPPAPPPVKLNQIKAQAQRQKPRKRAAKKAESSHHPPGHPPVVTRPKEKSPVAPTPDAPVPEMWSWVTLVDTVVTSHPTVFTRDTKYFFQPSGSTLKIYSTATGQVVSTLSTPFGEPTSSGSKTPPTHHTQPITSVVLNPSNPYQIFTGSLDGSIKVWDFLEPALLKTINVGNPVTHMCVHESLEGYVFVGVKMPDITASGAFRKPTTRIYRVSLNIPSPLTASEPDRAEKTLKIMYYVGKAKPLTGLAISPTGTWLVCTSGQRAHVANTSSLQEGFTKFVSTDHLTCLAFHPTDEYFATGDSKGQIRLWYCLNEGQLSFEKLGAEKKAVTTVLHWHAHPVQSLAFTPNGAYLLSGGEESVLVLWQIETGHKEFVPRVGAPIRGISIVQTEEYSQEYLLSLADGTLSFINASTLKIMRSSTRIKLRSESQNAPHDFSQPLPSLKPPLAVHPKSQYILLPSSHPSSLQIYSPHSTTLICELEVSPTNRITGPNSPNPMSPVTVTHAVVSLSGAWLATIDVRKATSDFETDVTLKLWKWAPQQNTYLLNTRIDRPHGKGNVGLLLFGEVAQNGSPMLISGAEDKNVKLWGTRSMRSSKKTPLEEYWVLRSSFGYRGEKPSSAAFSNDGSLLAIAFGSFITLWDPISNALLHVITNLALKALTGLAFVGESCRYLAVAGAEKDALLWDVVTGGATWQIPTARQVSQIIPLPGSDIYALIIPTTQGTSILILSPASWVPLRIWTLDFQLLSVTSFASAFPRGFSLAAITHDLCVVLIGDHVWLPPNEGIKGNDLTEQQEISRVSLFEDIFGASAFKSLRPSDAVLHSPDPTKLAAEGARTGMIDMRVLDGPAYLLPPIETLFESLMNDVLREMKSPEGVPLRDGTAEPEMDVDEPTPHFTKLTAPPTERIITDKEVGCFASLFREHGSLVPPVSLLHINGNGVTKELNGLSSTPIHINGTQPSTKKSKKPKFPIAVLEVASQDSTASSPATTPVTVGQKRKLPSP